MSLLTVFQTHKREERVICSKTQLKNSKSSLKFPNLSLVWLLCLCFLANSHGVLAKDNKTCLLQQKCIHAPGMCFSPQDGTFNPELKIREPQPLDQPMAQTAIKKVCPMYAEQGMPLCCINDQAKVLENNFGQIDTVFGLESGTCGVNLKILWCHFTCDPNQRDFVGYGGIKQIKQAGGDYKNFTKITFAVNDDYACTIFRSCRKVSLVAQADLQSSLAFLDFLGVNGQNQSLSIITFQFDPLNSTNSSNGTSQSQNLINIALNPRLKKKCNLEHIVEEKDEDLLLTGPPTKKVAEEWKISESESGNNFTEEVPQPLNASAYPCSYKINEDQILANYTNVSTSTCTFCDEICQAPNVDSSIGFFDGFDKITVGIVYAVLAVVSISWQMYVWFCRDPKTRVKLEEIMKDQEEEEEEEEGNGKTIDPDQKQFLKLNSPKGSVQGQIQSIRGQSEKALSPRNEMEE